MNYSTKDLKYLMLAGIKRLGFLANRIWVFCLFLFVFIFCLFVFSLFCLVVVFLKVFVFCFYANLLFVLVTTLLIKYRLG